MGIEAVARRWQTPGLRRGAPSGQRWRTFADAVAAALGVNVWVSLVLLPALYGGVLGGRAALAMVVAPLAVLALGVIRRSESVLLLGYPSALLLPLATAPETAQVHIYSPWRFALVAVGLVAYLFGASVFTSFHEVAPPASSRSLVSAGVTARKPGSPKGVPARWRRRFRVYAGLTILSAVFPLVLIWAIHFKPDTQELLRERYAGRVPEALVFYDLAAIGVWVVLFSVFFLGLLKVHRTGDRELQADLAALAVRARHPRPGPSFYVGVVAAIAFMALLVLLRR